MGDIHRHEGLANKNFEKPEGLTTISYCSATGLAPTDLCSQDYYGKTPISDLATKGFGGPGGTCDMHKAFDICKESGNVNITCFVPEGSIKIAICIIWDFIAVKVTESKMKQAVGKGICPFFWTESFIDIYINMSFFVYYSRSFAVAIAVVSDVNITIKTTE